MGQGGGHILMMLGIVQARASSTRLPNKVLMPILGASMLARQLERLKRCKRIDKLVVATSTDASDDAVETQARLAGVDAWRGSLDDVLDRFVDAARAHGAAHVVRLTGDCPLADPAVIDATIALYRQSGADYASNTNPPTFPDGLDVEVTSMAVLERAWREATKPSEREHVTLYIHQNPDKFRLANHASARDLSHLRWTVDKSEDFTFVSAVYAALYPGKPDFDTQDILDLLEQEPSLGRQNAHIARNEGLAASLRADHDRK